MKMSRHLWKIGQVRVVYLPCVYCDNRNLCYFYSYQDFRKRNDWQWNQRPETTRPCRWQIWSRRSRRSYKGSCEPIWQHFIRIYYHQIRFFLQSAKDDTSGVCDYSSNLVLTCFAYWLRRRIEGVPNFRRVPMVLRPVHSGNSSPEEESDFVVEENGKMICGWSVALRNVFRICISIHVC